MNNEQKNINKNVSLKNILKKQDTPDKATILAYLKNELTDEEKNQVEQTTIGDLLLEEALEGLTSVNSVKVEESLKELESKINTKAGLSQPVDIDLTKLNITPKKILLVAASIALLISVFPLYNWIQSNSNTHNEIADSKPLKYKRNKKSQPNQSSSYYATERESILDTNIPVTTITDGSVLEKRETTTESNANNTPQEKKEVKESVESVKAKKSNSLEVDTEEAESLKTSDPVLAKDEVVKAESISMDVAPVEEKIMAEQVSRKMNGQENDAYQSIKTEPAIKSAQFPGGSAALKDYISKNLSYPSDEKENGVGGIVKVGFLVDKKGKIKDINIISGVSKPLDSEAIKLVKSMPRWEPATENGEAVEQKNSVDVLFK